MKRFFGLALVAVSLLFVVSSCDSSGDSDYHHFGADSQTKKYPVEIYADQTVDTVTVKSTDTWKADTDCTWLLFANGTQKETKNIKYTYLYVNESKEAMTIAANTTGKVRTTTIKFDANGRTIGLPYTQVYWLNISTPKATFDNTTTYSNVAFNKSVKATDTTAEIAFTLYNKATLTSNNSWIIIPVEEFEKGSYNFNLELEKNTTGSSRTGTITLKSETGVSNIINIIQNS